MASLRDIRRRIGSVKNTRQITRAMKLVAGAKLRRATEAALAARPYQQTLQTVLDRVAAAVGDVEHPLLTVPNNDSDVLMVVMGSNRGLCGSFNNGLFRHTHKQIQELETSGKTVRLITVGKKAGVFFKARGGTVMEEHLDVPPEQFGALADSLVATLTSQLHNDEFSKAYLVYNRFVSVMTQEASVEQTLPMVIEGGDEQSGGDYLFEPAGDEILGELLPMALRARVYQALLETEAGEQAARMTAMDSATRNASDLIDSLTLVYNRARQAAITKELIEIVSGAEAL